MGETPWCGYAMVCFEGEVVSELAELGLGAPGVVGAPFFQNKSLRF